MGVTAKTDKTPSIGYALASIPRSAAVDDNKADQAFRRIMRRERFAWIKDELRGVALLAAIILMIFGLAHVLGIEGPLFSDDEMNDPAPR